MTFDIYVELEPYGPYGRTVLVIMRENSKRGFSCRGRFEIRRPSKKEIAKTVWNIVNDLIVAMNRYDLVTYRRYLHEFDLNKLAELSNQIIGKIYDKIGELK